ncbi:hypothetical protein B0H66DRAFT_528031 [Apodospora peruviana]|uniref:Uncharacterized protein n=1 Tax=Apodospora peruviana TaxID=516989 RepID=A0AAE0ITI5_9PEZI|nr:hypothetical protein B0H66DRAFT_528031 [Apodospora peruviana]
MSSPGQIADPAERPPSGLPANFQPTLSSVRTQSFKAYGQDYQFAETWNNPPPELVVDNGQSSAAAESTQADGTQEHSQSEAISKTPGGIWSKDAAVWVPPPEEPWYKRIPKMWWIIGGVILVGITVVVLAILGAMNLLTSHTSVSLTPVPHAPDSFSSGKLIQSSTSDVSAAAAPSSSGLSSSASGTSTTTSAHSNPTTVIKNCSDSSSLIKDVLWMGLNILYDSNFDGAGARTSEQCCKSCFASARGCAGWFYNSSNIYTPCTQVLVRSDQAGADSKCPKGYADSTLYTLGGGGVAGIGPCSLSNFIS